MSTPVAAYSLLAEEDDLRFKVPLEYFYGTHFGTFKFRWNEDQQCYLIKIFNDKVHEEFIALYQKRWSDTPLVMNKLTAPLRSLRQRRDDDE